VIRRGFWLTAGAVAGIYGYRRASAVAHRLSATLNPGARQAPPAGLALRAGRARTAGLAPTAGRHARRGVLAVAREAYRFTRDVREGMELYKRGHSAPGANDPASRLGGDTAVPDRPRGTPRESTLTGDHPLPFEQQTTTLNPRTATDGVG